MQQDLQFEFPIIDVRSETAYIERHLVNSAHIPANELEQRTHELPAKNIPLNIVGEPNQINVAVPFLQAKGYKICAIQQVSSEQWYQLFEPAQVTTGSISECFWRPASVIQYFCDQVVTDGKSKTALDLACGAGRDSIFLAQKGWQMTSVDYSEHALARVKGSAVRAGLNLQCIELDLERNSEALLALNRTFDMIVVVRYLHRPLLGLLEQLLSDSGYLVYQTFMQGSEKFGSPKNPRFLLQENELAKKFSHFKIILNRIEHLDDGRPINSFVAQKISD